MAGGINLFAYVANSPALATDPLGLYPPSHPYCIRLAAKIANLQAMIARQISNIALNPGNLPVFGGPRARSSVHGHVTGPLATYQAALAKNIALYAQKCSDPEP